LVYGVWLVAIISPLAAYYKPITI